MNLHHHIAAAYVRVLLREEYPGNGLFTQNFDELGEDDFCRLITIFFI
jgi:hypothetical protein